MKIANKLVAKRNIRMKGGGRWKESEIVKYKYKQTREMCFDLFSLLLNLRVKKCRILEETCNILIKRFRCSIVGPICAHFVQQYYEITWPSLNVQKDEGNWRSAWLTKKRGPLKMGYIAQYDCFCHRKYDKTGSSVNFWHETHTGVKTSKQCGLVTCLRSVRLNVCACLGGCSRGIFSKSEWLWGLMGLKRSVGTVSWWEHSSGWECTDPLDPAHIQQQSYLTGVSKAIFLLNGASFCSDCDYLTGSCECPICAGNPSSVL